MLFPFVSLMGVESKTEPAVEVTDPAEPAVVAGCTYDVFD